jgi:hypothetical protein
VSTEVGYGEPLLTTKRDGTGKGNQIGDFLLYRSQPDEIIDLL